MERVAIFPGSFDPFTRGHEAIVTEALRMFDKVIVAIGHNSAKRGLLTPEARKRLIEQIYNGDARVEVTTYSTLTGDEARRVGATTIIRSVRNATDFDYERTMDHANREIFPELRTIIIIAPAEVEHISSSLVRELRAFGHDTSTLLPQGITLEDFIEH
ncbi:MAG: pantetheine-phosphate adenylyltransferase [Alistipes sp.]|nr:pantetheine-phosphate adenylyltransferase [Alistipes sp.]MBO5972785.1 pantetheine-phosphate adenylyltransferase [Alistipes sp.]